MPAALTLDSRPQQVVDLRGVARFTAAVALAALAFCLTAALWLSTCGADVETAACNAPQRFGLAAGAPLIVAAGGLWAFAQTYAARRDRNTFWSWLVAGCFLACLLVAFVLVSAPPMVGPVFAD